MKPVKSLYTAEDVAEYFIYLSSHYLIDDAHKGITNQELQGALFLLSGLI
jgi:hypothetical protein